LGGGGLKEKRMRSLIVAIALVAAGPAAAGTLQEMTTHGVVLSFGLMKADVSYTPDGKFSAAGGRYTGTWRIDGDKLCTRSSKQPTETCTAYPLGKKSGDSFQMTGPHGSATVTIK
jgi:hypothetical protein